MYPPPSDDDAVAFPKLDDTQLAALDALGTRRSIAAGEYLFREGDPAAGWGPPETCTFFLQLGSRALGRVHLEAAIAWQPRHRSHRQRVSRHARTLPLGDQ